MKLLYRCGNAKITKIYKYQTYIKQKAEDKAKNQKDCLLQKHFRE